MHGELFGTLPDGTPVHRWTLERAGVRVRILTYGGIVQSVEVPDRDGRAADVVLGFADVDGYLAHPEPYFGALVGRYANRIAGGRFALDGRTYHLAQNNGPNSLHGGERGFDKRVWDAEPVEHGVRLTGSPRTARRASLAAWRSPRRTRWTRRARCGSRTRRSRTRRPW